MLKVNSKDILKMYITDEYGKIQKRKFWEKSKANILVVTCIFL